MKKITFIVWQRYHRRSELLAQHFGATIHYICHGRMGQLSQAPIRYFKQAWQTWSVLRQERPDIIFVQNPPIFAVILVSLYSRCYGARYIIDSHTGAFVSRKWRWSVGLHRMLSHEALMTIVHNESQGRLLQRWGCPYQVLAFTPGDYPDGEPYPLSKKYNVAVICGFEEDEPLEILFDAAGYLKDVCFYMTGDAQRLERRLLIKKPENIRLTGFLAYERYIGLLRGVSAIIDLVDNEHTLLMGGFEAISLGVPLIVSDWPLLRNFFSLGAIYIPNTVEGVLKGVRQMQAEHARKRCDILILREQLQAEWAQKIKELQQFLSENN